MPLISDGIKSKTAGKSGVNNRIYQLLYGIPREYTVINTKKLSLSTGSCFQTLEYSITTYLNLIAYVILFIANRGTPAFRFCLDNLTLIQVILICYLFSICYISL